MIDDSRYIVLAQRCEEDDLIKPVEELRTEVRVKKFHYRALGLFAYLFRFRMAFKIRKDLLRPDVGSHDQDRVLEVHGPSLGVRDPAVNSTTLYGLRRTASVSWPPSS